MNRSVNSTTIYYLALLALVSTSLPVFAGNGCDPYYDPELATRLEQLNSEKAEAFRRLELITTFEPDPPVQGVPVTVTTEDQSSGLYFSNRFYEDIWSLEHLFKRNYKDLYASEILIKQYLLASERGGFKGQFPKVIKFKTVVTFVGLEIGEQSAAEIKMFEESSPLGKIAKHLLTDLRMEITELNFYESMDIELKVKPISR